MTFFRNFRALGQAVLRKWLWLLGCWLVGCAGEQTSQPAYDASPHAEAIKDFWNWFQNEKQVFETMTDSSRDERLNMLLDHLHGVSGGLAVEVSKEFHGVRDLIISADGDKSKFAIVKEIVKAAPALQGWTVIAFRQRAREDFVLTYKRIRLSPREMYFQPMIEKDSLDLIIYADSLVGKNRADVLYYGLITMDNVLGEYAATVKVRHFDFRDLREEKNKRNLRKLNVLPSFVDAFYASRHKEETSIDTKPTQAPPPPAP